MSDSDMEKIKQGKLIENARLQMQEISSRISLDVFEIAINNLKLYISVDCHGVG